jgi:hypothetical protein
MRDSSSMSSISSTSSIGFVSGEHGHGLNDHRIFQLAKLAFEHVVVRGLLTKHLLEPHLALTDRAGRFLDLRHDSSFSASADRLGFRLWWGWRDNARAKKWMPIEVELYFSEMSELENFTIDGTGCRRD